MVEYDVVPLTDTYRDWANQLIEERWGGVAIVTRGRIHDTSVLPGFVAVGGGKPMGLATYRMENDCCEMVSLDSLVEMIGIGTALVEAIKEEAVSKHCRRLWLITTNDNVNAIRFYQKRGFQLVAVHRNALELTRRLKPSLPQVGMDGIPLRDEIEMEMLLS